MNQNPKRRNATKILHLSVLLISLVGCSLEASDTIVLSDRGNKTALGRYEYNGGDITSACLSGASANDAAIRFCANLRRLQTLVIVLNENANLGLKWSSYLKTCAQIKKLTFVCEKSSVNKNDLVRVQEMTELETFSVSSPTFPSLIVSDLAEISKKSSVVQRFEIVVWEDVKPTFKEIVKLKQLHQFDEILVYSMGDYSDFEKKEIKEGEKPRITLKGRLQ